MAATADVLSAAIWAVDKAATVSVERPAIAAEVIAAKDLADKPSRLSVSIAPSCEEDKAPT
ncbi:hypothetical protein D3C71_1406390 [compost metagenome]